MDANDPKILKKIKHFKKMRYLNLIMFFFIIIIILKQKTILKDEVIFKRYINDPDEKKQ
jgi:hypothetical protein